ncbi:hypothetical protein FF38_13573 [Lucilia cuprina]|uniref:Uncharacterized protein n=1 Tax=Lucilia cuprina TaxID=7375 RepID=A0A0L0BX82_LUCCU|nr:hypothetical protein FF38_13573 [Lucilia cuprina]
MYPIRQWHRRKLLSPSGMHDRVLIISNFSSAPLFSSFCSIEVIIRHEARRAPITFLYATDKRLRSSTVNSTSIEATFFMASTISLLSTCKFIY